MSEKPMTFNDMFEAFKKLLTAERALADALMAALIEQVRLTHSTPVSRQAEARYREARGREP